MLEGTTETAEPTLEDVINGLDEQTTTEAPQSKPQAEVDGISKAEEKLEYHRKMRAQEKRIKELEERIKKASEATKQGVDLDSPNPIRDIIKAKKLSQDDIVRLAIEAMEDDGDQDAGKTIKNMTPEEIIAEAKRQLKKELEEEQNQKAEKENIKKSNEESFKVIDQYVTENEAKFPLIKGLGGIDTVYAEIEKDYLDKVEEFGEEFAKKNVLTIEQASKKVNDALANSVKDALKSNHLRTCIKTLLKDEQGGDEDLLLSEEENQLEESPTLNNSDFKPTAQTKRFDPSDEDENWKAALALLD